MKKIIVPVLFLLMIANTSSAQSADWKKVRIADSVLLTAIRFSDSLTGYVAGRASILTAHGNTTIYKTMDGGNSWTELAFNGLTKTLGYVNPISLFVAGDSGVFMSNSATYKLIGSTNRGATWKAIDSSIGNPTFAFWSAFGGIRAEDHQIYKTSDGGVTWTLVYTPRLDSLLHFLQVGNPVVLDSLNWLFPVVQSSALSTLRTSDGGKTWDNITSTPPGWKITGSGPLQLTLKPNDDLFFCYAGATAPFLYSSDLGSSWTSTHSDPNCTSPLIAPVSKDTQWVVGYWQPSETYGMWSTTNFGGNWVVDTNSFVGVPLNDATFLDSRHGWVLGDSADVVQYYYTGSAYVYIYQPETLAVSPSPLAAVAAISCYPNPVTSRLSLSGLSAGPNHLFRIYDELGRELKSGKLASDGTVDISNLIQGNYRIEIPGEGSCSFIKLR